MFAAPLIVACKALDPQADFHPDLDERDLQCCLSDRLHALENATTNNTTASQSLSKKSESARMQPSPPRPIPVVACSEELSPPSSASALQYKEEAVNHQEEAEDIKEIKQKEEEEEDRELFIFSPVKEGWLIKRGSGGLRIWRRRWVTLANSRLWYASGPPARKEDASHDKGIGWMELTQWTQVIDDDQDLTFTVMPCMPPEGAEKDGMPLQGRRRNSAQVPGDESDDSNEVESEVVTLTANGLDKGDSVPLKHGEGWRFRAESLQEKVAWMDKIRRCIALAAWWSDLVIGPSLGEGAFSQVHEIIDRRTGERFAVKCMEARKRLERDQILAEVEILSIIKRQIRHPHLTAPKCVYVEGNRVWIMFPLCPGGDLFGRLVADGPPTEMESAAIMARILSAVQALHQYGILHLDMKPENILFGPDGPLDVRLTDFGLSRRIHLRQEEEMGGRMDGEQEEVEEDVLSGMQKDAEYLVKRRYNQAYDERVNGTIGYMSPEVVMHKSYTPAADVWGLGVVLHILLVGYPPFPTIEGQEVEALERLIRGDFEMDAIDWARITPAAKDLVKKMLTVHVSERITIDEALSHPWILSMTKKGEPIMTAGSSTGSTTNQKGDGQTKTQTGPLSGFISSSFSAMLRSPIIRGSFIGRLTSPTAVGGGESSTSSSSSSSSSSSVH